MNFLRDLLINLLFIFFAFFVYCVVVNASVKSGYLYGLDGKRYDVVLTKEN